MKKVLVVDDEPHVCRIIQLTLQREGYHVESANDGIAGLEKIRLKMPDILIADIDMPRMNGREMCTSLMQEFPDTACQIFISTSRTEEEFRTWTEPFDNVHFLEKPMSFRILLKKLSALMTTEN